MISINQQKVIDVREKIKLLLNYLIIAYAFVIPFEYTITKEFVKIMIVLWIFSFDYKKFLYIVKNNRLFQLLLIFSVFLFSSYLWSDSHPDTVYGDFMIFYKSYTTYFLFPLVIIIMSLKNKYILIAINSYIFSIFINAIISFGIYFKLWNTQSGSVNNPIPFQISHISYSVFLALGLFLILYKIIESRRNYLKILWMLPFLIIFMDLFLTKGRTGQFSFILTFILLSIIYLKKHIKILALSILCLFVSLFISYKYINTFNLRVDQFINDTKSVFNQKRFDTSFGTRLMNFSTIPYLVNKENIFFGVGLGDREEYIKNKLKKGYPYKISAFKDYGRLHNMYLEILISNGIIGLFLLLSIFYSIFKIKFKNDFFQYFTYSFCSIFIFVGLTGDIFFFYELSLLFGFFLSLIIVKFNEENYLILVKNENI